MFDTNKMTLGKTLRVSTVAALSAVMLNLFAANAQAKSTGWVVEPVYSDTVDAARKSTLAQAEDCPDIPLQLQAQAFPCPGDPEPDPDPTPDPTPTGVIDLVADNKVLAAHLEPEIQALAAGLKNDAKLIVDYVHDKILFSPSYGINRSAIGTLRDGYGNYFEQANLALALLKAAGVTGAELVHGTVNKSYITFGQELGIQSTAVNPEYFAESTAGYQVDTAEELATLYSNFPMAYVRFDGQVYAPGQKSLVSGFDWNYSGILNAAASAGHSEFPVLETAMGFDLAAFTTAAESGVVIDADSAMSLNRQSIRDKLDGYADNLVSYLKTNHPQASVTDLLGQELKDLNDNRTTGISTEVNSWASESAIPASLLGTIRVEYKDIDATFYTKDIYDRSFSLQFNSSNKPQLVLDGQVLATGALSSYSDGDSMDVTVTLANDGSSSDFFKLTNDTFIATKGIYNIVSYYGPIAQSTTDGIASRLKKLNQQLPETSNQVISQTLHGMGAYFVLGTSLNDALLSRTYETIRLRGMLGVAATHDKSVEGSPFVSIGAIQRSRIHYDMDKTRMMFWADSGLEHMTVEHTQGIGALSTTKYFDLVNDKGHSVLKVDRSNLSFFRAMRDQPLDIGISPTVYDRIITTIEAEADAYALVPIRVSNTEFIWRDIAYYLSSPTRGGFLVGGNYHGGVGQTPTVPNPDQTGGTLSDELAKTDEEGNPTVGDPINFVTGDFLLDETDITIGTRKALAFSRHYDSSGQNDDQVSTMGKGWRHNFDVFLTQGHNINRSFNGDSVIDAYAPLIAHYVARAVANSKASESVELGQYGGSIYTWMTDKLSGNVVNLISSTGSSSYSKLADGSFNSPNGSTNTMAKVGDTYTVSSLDGVVMAFNSDDQLSTITSREGEITTFNYDNEVLSNVENHYGLKLTLGYTDGYVSSVTDNSSSFDTESAADRVIDFGHVGGELRTFTNAEDEVTTYAYDTSGLTHIYKPGYAADAYLINEYDSWGLGQVSKQTSPFNGEHLYYYSNGYRSEEVGPSGQSLVMHFNQFGLATKKINAVGEITEYSYNGLQQLAYLNHFNDTGSLLRNTAYRYFDNNLLKSRLMSVPFNVTTGALDNRPEGVPAWASEILGEFYTYEGPYQLIKTLEVIDGISVTLNEDGDPIGTSPSRKITTYNYDDSWKLETLDPPQVSDVDGTLITPQSSYTYFAGTHDIKTVTNADGVVTQYSYYPSGEANTVTIDPQGENLITSYVYNGWGDVSTQTNPLGHVSKSVYDQQRRQTDHIKRFDLVTESSPAIVQTETEYGDNGRAHLVKRRSNNTALHPTGWHTTTYTYIKSGNVDTVTDPAGDIIDYDYDNEGRLEYKTDGNDRKTRYEYDNIHRQTVVSQRVGAAYVATETKAYGYDADGLRYYSMTDGNDKVSVFTYDRLDRLKSITYPDDTTESYAYHWSTRQVGSLFKRDGIEIKKEYDALERLTSKTVPLNTGQTEVFEYLYTPGGKIKKENQVNGFYNTTKTTEYFYDALKRLDYIIYPSQNSAEIKVDYGVDKLGRKTSLEYPGSDTYALTYKYDDFGRLEHIERGGSNVVSYGYTSLSQRNSIIYANGTSTAILFENDGDVDQVNHQFNNDSMGYDYSYNGAGQQEGLSISGSAKLWIPTATVDESYTPNELNQYDDISGVPIEYDDNGAVSSVNNLSYSHDASGQLTRVNTRQGGGTDSSYVYNAQGKRESLRGVIKPIVFTYDGNNVIQQYAQYDGEKTTRFIHAGLDQPVLMDSAEGDYYYHQDKSGSVVAISDSSGNLVETYAYGPFGQSDDTSSVGNPYRYTARWLDENSGLYYNRARYYNPKWGRFAQADPIGYGDGMNMYAYVNNDPLNMFDPFGLSGKNSTQDTEGWTENWFFEGNHKYGRLSPEVCSSSQEGCTLQKIVAGVNASGVHPNQINAFVPGEEHIGDVDIPGPWGIDHVNSTAIFNDQGVQIGVRNVTLENHFLHPGIVERTVVEIDGSFHIFTEGGGFGLWGGPNIWLDDLIWGPIDEKLIETFKVGD